jgi:hypothetical protein
MLIPSLIDLGDIFNDQATYFVELLRCKSIVSRQRNGFKPKLAGLSLALDVNVWRLVAIEAVKVESIRAGDSMNVWHGILIPKLLSINFAHHNIQRPDDRRHVGNETSSA